MNVAAKFARDRLMRDWCSKKQLCFTEWKEYCVTKRLRMRRLNELIAKAQHQVALDAIRECAWGLKVNSRLSARLKKFCYIFRHRRLQVAISKWKEASYFEVVQHYEATKEHLYHRDRNDAFDREKLQLSIVRSMLCLRLGKIYKGSFLALVSNAQRKRLEKVKIGQGRDKVDAVRVRRAIQKWRLRAQATIFARQKKNNYQLVGYRHMFLRKCFTAMRQQFELKTRIARILSHLSTQSSRFQLDFAFK